MSEVNYSFGDIAKIISGKVFGDENATLINHLLIDSRKIYSPKDSIFFAIDGERHNGHHYILQLIKKGVTHFVVSDKQFVNTSANFIVVKDTLTALQTLAASHRNSFDLKVIGITGSNGKTVVKEWLYQLLKDNLEITRSPKSYNSQVGVPLSLWLLNSKSELAIFEAGISTKKEMHRLAKMIKPEIGIFTNIGEAHASGFVDINEKIKEKSNLFKKCKTIIYGMDYPEIDDYLSCNFNSEKLFTWSASDSSANLFIKSIKKDTNDSSSISVQYEESDFTFKIPFQDKASVENAIICVCALICLNRLNTNVLESMKSLSPVSMRLELRSGMNHCVLINDTYNADINSLKVALDYLKLQHEDKALILSDIAGYNVSYSEVASIINQYNLKKFIGVGENLIRNSDKILVEDKLFYNSTNELLADLKFDRFNKEAILIKGSRDFSFEKVTKRLESKVHLTKLEIDLEAIVSNLNYFKSRIRKSTKVMAMVKAFSYGSGSVEIANLLEFHRVDYLAVAYADEGVLLRKNGITLPIMVMNPEENSFDTIIKYNLEPELYSFSILGKFIGVLEQNFNHSNLPYPIHIKVDTGMHRLGFLPKELSQLGLVLNSCKNTIKVVSVFSHLAASDNPNEELFTKNQINKLQLFVSGLTDLIQYKFFTHILNSGGIERYPEAQLDMVRLGIGLYGISSQPSVAKKMKTVSTLKSTISQIKFLDKGETVGYNRRGKLSKATKVAVVAIGYADGIRRELGNGRYYFLVEGEKAYTVGDICMDMCMIDVTNISCEVGDEVVLFGKEHDIKNMADSLNTISYEILTGISQRVKRVYFQE